MKIVNIHQLLQSTSEIKRKIEGLLPELIKRLIINTVSEIKYLRFPSGDNVWAPGFDGILESEQESRFVPAGKSFWEFGTSGLEKINRDYEKRTTETEKSIRERTSFILIVPKIWAFDKTIIEWQKCHNDWKNVNIYDADILDDWLEENLAVALWFLNEIGSSQNILKCDTVFSSWNKIAVMTKPKLNKDIFINDREDNQKDLIEKITTEKITYVKSESRFESLGFTIATILKSENKELISKTILVDDLTSFDKIDTLVNGHFIIANFEYSGNLSNSNKYIFPISNYEKNATGVELFQRGQRKMNELLCGIGLDSDYANEINHKSNGSMLVIRRLIADNFVDKKPAWASLPNKELLIPIMFFQKIDLKNDDQKLIASFITKKEFPELEIAWNSFAMMEDAPIRKIGTIYQIISVEEIWYVFNLDTTSNVFSILCEIILVLLGLKTSDSLQTTNINKGIIDSLLNILTLFGIKDNQSQKKVDQFISQLLIELDEKPAYIISLLSKLSEVSPTSILNFIEQDIIQQDSIISSAMLTEDYHQILWALEYLTCLNETKIGASNILFHFLKMNVNYKISNSPKNSLKNIFAFGISISSLSLKEKEELLIKHVQCDNPATVLELIFDLIIQNMCAYGISFHIRRKEICSEIITWNAIFALQNTVLQKIFEQIVSKNLYEYLEKIVDNYSHFSQEELNRVVDLIKENKNKISTTILYSIYRKAISEICTIRKFSKHDNWKERMLYVPLLENIVDATKSNDLFEQKQYLFENLYDSIDLNPLEYDDENYDFRIEDKRKLEIRINAIEEIKSVYKENTVFKLIDFLKDENSWGMFLAVQFKEKNEIKEILDLCIQKNKINLLLGYLNRLEGFNEVVTLVNNFELDLQKKLLPYLNNLDYEIICDTEEKIALFYSKKEYYKNSEAFDESLFEKILKYNPFGCLYYFYDRNLDNDTYKLGLRVLQSISQIEEKNSHDIHMISKLANNLDNYQYCDELAIIEISMLGIFEEKFPKSVKTYWFENPNKFYEYYMESITKKEGVNYFSLSYDFCLDKEHFNNEDKFNYYFNTIIELFIKNNPEKDYYLGVVGNILGKSIKGLDGIFPHEFTRAFLEQNNEVINRNFLVGFMNSRGVRCVGNGSDQISLANKYKEYAKSIELMYPVTARLLKKIADDYERTGFEDKIDDLLGY